MRMTEGDWWAWPINRFVTSPFKMAEISVPDSSSAAAPKTFTLLCWNIDGLDERDTVERTHSVCDFIQSRQPHAVFLQEVVPGTEKEILKRLSVNYDYYSAPQYPFANGYFVAILVLKTKGLLVRGEVKSMDFPKSSMGRHVIEVSVSYCGVELELLTSHLESTKDYGAERKNQLSTVFKMMSEIQKKNPEKTLIFGGDLNVRDAEVKAVGLPPNTVDVWEACGSREEDKFTWNIEENDNLVWKFPFKPKLRFDRMYLASCDGKVSSKSFSLVGKDRLPGCGRFPSDHWGLWMEFGVHGI